jgi:hypothetical protein
MVPVNVPKLDHDLKLRVDLRQPANEGAVEGVDF